MSKTLDVNAHAARAARDGSHGCLEISRRQIRHLRLGDLFQLGAGNLANLDGVRHRTALFDLRRFPQQNRSRRRLFMKVKLRSLYTVITTGIGMPCSMLCVSALNALQNSMMFTPC